VNQFEEENEVNEDKVLWDCVENPEGRDWRCSSSSRALAFQV
jgi:hypothetical protein